MSCCPRDWPAALADYFCYWPPSTPEIDRLDPATVIAAMWDGEYVTQAARLSCSTPRSAPGFSGWMSRGRAGQRAGIAYRRRRKAVRLPELAPDNELPAALDAGPFIWRSTDVGITATGFLAYSTGVLFRLVVLSKGVNLSDEDPLESFAGERRAYGRSSERPAGTLRLGAHGVPVTTRSASRHENRLEIEAWTAFPPDGDLVFHLEWPAEGIEHSEFRIPRSSAAQAVALWPPGLLSEQRRRHDKLTPSFLVHVEPWAEGSDLMRMRVVQQGPPAVDHLDSLALHISNDDSYWPDERKVAANGHIYEEVRNQVWAPYRFTPGTGPGEARAARHGREITYEAPLPAGEELAFQLEPTRPGSWSDMPQEEWQRQRGNAIRLAITPVHHEH